MPRTFGMRGVHDPLLLVPVAGSLQWLVSAVAPTPPSNTGVKLTGWAVESESGEAANGLRLSIDYFTGTYFGPYRRILRVLKWVLGHEPRAGGGMHGYVRSYRWAGGAVLLFDPLGGGDRCTVSLPGQACRAVGVEALPRLLWTLHGKHGVRFSRVDIALDDPSKVLIPLADVHRAAEAGEYCFFQKHEIHQCGGKAKGHTVGFGARGGDGRQVVFYDKEAESGGEFVGNRMEVRFSGKSAAVVGEVICQDHSRAEFHLGNFYRRVLKIAMGAIEFREGSKRVQRSRRALCAWFGRLLASAATGVRLSVPRVLSSLQSVAMYVKRMRGSLYEVVESMEQAGLDGWGTLRRLVEDGKNRPRRRSIEGEAALGFDVQAILEGTKAPGDLGCESW